ncbi:hypothetical protein PFBG_00159, partial [Plasmodium falciparum 7G8]
VCKKITTQEEGRISFENVNSRGGDGVAASGGTSDTSGTNDINNGTFYRSKYCQPCPDCGVKKKDGDSGNEWEEKQRDEKCKRGNIYKPGSGATPTDVTILKSGEGHDDIAEKLKAFCDKKDGGGGSGDCGGNSDSSLCEKWKCYKGEDVMKAEDDDDEQDYLNMKNAGGLCILKKENKSSKEPADIQKTYNDFFYYWVVHMLKDSIYWRTEKLDKCINNTNGKQTKCKKGCNNDCECFLKWVNRKRTEWGKIKEQFSKQEGIPEGYYFITLEGVLELEFANENSTKDAENNVSAEEAKEIKHLRDIIKKKKEEEEAAGGSGIGAAPDGKKKTIMDKLIDYEKDEADLCLEIHEDEEEGGGNDECDDDHEETQIVKSNPCATPSGSRHRALANEAAQLMHKAAKTQLASRVGRSKLRAHAHLGTYKRGGSPSGFKKDKICSIDARHSNRNPEHSEEPCHGKGTGTDTGTRFEIGTVWEKDKTNMRVGHEEFIIPPRRRHMCTSNLEYLETGDVPFIGNNATLINDSFLGDVLLSAKYEAENIKKLYEKNKDQSGHEVICRAVRYSFADLGDIIRGRDLWEHGDQTKLQGHLKTIFGNIHKSLEGIQGNHKYKNDEYNTPPYKKLREDWWEANRHQVWKAMKCATKEINNNKCNGIPIDDYIPQRLRWMVEWAEWYCKYQSQEYENLVASCKGCMGNGQGCTKESGEICTKCDKQCKEYGKKIRTWKDQWTKIKEKYEELYLQAKITSTNAGSTVFPDAGPDYQQVVDFFKELQKEINRSASQRSKRSIDDTTTDPTLTSPYSTAEGYIHQELPHMECQVQKEFCKHKNGGTTPTGTENKEYVFKDKPHDHDTPCNCDKPPIKDACDIVDGILKEDHGDSKVGECNPKNKDNNYPAWQCDKSSNLVKENGICMPPRRQKLCLYYIAHHSQKIYLNTQKGLREAFIRTAAAETFVSWNYYKTKNGADAKQLDNGTIPEEFLRSMIYTFGDFRDICLDTDISKKLPRSDVSNAKDNIDAYFKKNPDPNRTKWWDENGPEIWKGMLCALEKASGKKEELTGPDSKYQYNKVTFSGDKSPTLEKFAQTPQFLRWFIEWGDDFCREQKKKYNELKEKCNKCCNNGNVTSDECKTKCVECQKKCEEYKGFITEWQENWNKQKNKYETLYTQVKSTSRSTISSSDPIETKLLKYLNELKDPYGNSNIYSKAAGYIKKEGYIEDCNVSKQNNFDENKNGGNDEKYAFKEPPKEYEKACKCNENTPPSPPELPGPPATDTSVDVCETVKSALTIENLKEACPTKYGSKAPTSWKCIPSGEKSGAGATTERSRDADGAPSGSSEKGSICVPPRRRRLYVGKLEQWAEKTQSSQAEGSSATTQEGQVKVNNKDGASSSSSDSNSVQTTLNAASSTSTTESSQLLRQAFIQSAAIETFFLWHRYKKEKEKEKEDEEKKKKEQHGSTFGTLEGLSVDGEEEEQPPQEELQSGKIPYGFLRQMFYTLADYKDILYSGSNDNLKHIVLEASGTKEEKEDMQKIQDKIKKTLNGDNNQESGHPPSPSEKNSVTTPQTWWNAHAPSIWHGMICALTHKESDATIAGGGKIEQNTQLKNALLDDTKNKPKDNYKYDKVKLDENSGTSPKPAGVNEAPPKLTEFVERPPYFRWLEEWGESFCRKQKHKLEIIRVDCRGEDEDKHCSGYGENCDDNLIADPSIFPDLNCPGCAKHCSSYKKWIQRKKIEFTQQDNAYNNQKVNCEKESKGGGNGVCGKLEENAAKFLQKLGPCSKNNKDNGDGTINFKEPDVTFKPADNCKPCSEFKIDCTKAKCTGDEEKRKCNVKNETVIRATDIKDDKNGNENINMVVSDTSKKGDQDDLRVCRDAGIFKGIRKDEWICGNVCGYNVCKPVKVNGQNGDGNQIIIIKAFFKIWLAYFLEDYNKIKKKLKSCTKSSDATPCIKGCALEWLKKKTTEWKNLKNLYLQQYENKSSDKSFLVKTILEEFKDRPEFQNAIKPCKELEKFESFCGLNGADNSKKSKDGKERDLVLCLIEKLGEKAEKCAENDAQNGVQSCTQTTTDPPTLEDEDLLLEEEENTVKAPEICGEMKEETKDKEEGECKAASPVVPESSGTEGTNGENEDEKPKGEEGGTAQETEQTNVIKPEKEASTTPKKPASKKEENLSPPSNVLEHPAVIPALVTSTLAWSVGIGFAAFTYFFLKKKTKSTIDLLRVINIPKSDYDIPTKLSPNRYIPYTSGKYRGKRSTNTNITTPSRHNVEEKPFITSIHDRDLYTGEEYSYDMSTNSGNNNLYSGENNVYGGIDPTGDNRGLTSGKHDSYSGIDLINDSLSGDYDIYDEVLKRKENELFGTKHPKHTTINRVAKLTNSDPIHNQLELFHKWLDRHRDMCEKWENHHERLAKLKEEWNKDNNSGDIHPSGNTPPTSDIPSGKQSDIPSDNNIHSDIPYVG